MPAHLDLEAADIADEVAEERAGVCSHPRNVVEVVGSIADASSEPARAVAERECDRPHYRGSDCGQQHWPPGQALGRDG